jgi:hypothetical protein
MLRGMCVPSVPPIAPLRLAPDYRDYPGRAHERLCEIVDRIANADCFRPRIFHAPDSSTENAGIAANGYLEYVLELPPGSILLGFLRSNTPVQNPNTSTDPPVSSGYKVQITDVERGFKFFQIPVPEAYFLNDIPSTNPLGPFAGENLYVQSGCVRLLCAPYPVAPPGQFKVQFYNLLDSVNKLVSLDFVIVEPDSGGSANAA